MSEKKYQIYDTQEVYDDFDSYMTLEEIKEFIINFWIDNHSFKDDEWIEYQEDVKNAKDVDELHEFLQGFDYAIMS